MDDFITASSSSTDKNEFFNLVQTNNLTELKKLKNIQNYLEELSEKDLTAITIAALNDNAEMIEWLVKQGADVLQNNANNERAIHFAIIHNKINALNYLLKLECSKKGSNNDNFLEFAVSVNAPEATRFLLGINKKEHQWRVKITDIFSKPLYFETPL